MFFHTSETLVEKTIRDTLKDESGRVLVILNIAYPACAEKKVLKKKSPLQQRLDPFYSQAAEGFAAFARGELLDKAKKNPIGTPPCGAVLHWKLVEETEETLSLCVEGSVFDGFDAHRILPDTRRWNKKTGLLCEPPKTTEATA